MFFRGTVVEDKSNNENLHNVAIMSVFNAEEIQEITSGELSEDTRNKIITSIIECTKNVKNNNIHGPQAIINKGTKNIYSVLFTITEQKCKKISTETEGYSKLSISENTFKNIISSCLKYGKKFRERKTVTSS